MPAPITITRPAYTDTDVLYAADFNAVSIYSATVRDASGSAEGVIRIAGDLDGTAAVPTIRSRAITAAKMFAVAAGTILGNFSTAQADVQQQALAAPILAFLQAPNEASARAAIGASNATGATGVNASDIIGLIQPGQLAGVNVSSFIGLIAAGQIASVNAGQITGVIQAGQIGSVNASTILGQLLATQIQAVNATSIVGTLSATQIGAVNASSIVGQILATQINSLAVTQLTGLIQSDQIQAVAVSKLSGLVQANQIQSVAATQITGQLSANQITSLAANQITGSLIATQISSVYANSITGVIVTQQLADGILNSLRLMGASSSFRLIQQVATLPTLPAIDYPLGSVVLRTTDRTFWKSGTSSWAQVKASDELTGALTAYDIQSVNATSIIGLITAAQIGSVNATAINGQIQAGQIATLAATQITGQLTASQIQSVNASAVNGLLQANQIAAVNAAAINGMLQANQIAGVYASTVTGLLQATQIGSINAATISIGLIEDSQLSAINAGKLIAGTVTADKLFVTALSAITANMGSVTAGSIDLSATNAFDRTTIQSGLLRQGRFQVVNSGGISTVVGISSGAGDAIELLGFGSVIPAAINFKNSVGVSVASISTVGASAFRSIKVNDGTTDVAVISATGDTSLTKLTITSYGIADGFGISFANDNNRLFEYYGINIRSQGALWPVRISGGALVMGAVGYGSSFAAGNIYFGGTDVYLYRNGNELWVQDSAGARRI